MRQKDPTKLGKGIFLNPYSGGGYEHPVYGKHNNHFGMHLFSKHGSTIANAVDIASGIADIVKTKKDIDRTKNYMN